MSESQTGALLACALQLGARAGGETGEAVAGGLNEFGRKLGAAIRVADDCDLFWPDGERDETRQGRLVAKKKTLPVAYVVESGSPTHRRRVGEIYMQRVIDPASIVSLTELLDAAEARKFSLTTISHLLDEAMSALEAAKLPPVAIELLSEAACFLAMPDGVVAPRAATGKSTTGGEA
jgi:geranylgeranyl pyrophosphate synthase